jgi:transcriptional regulator GlxA family with amidase domain
VSDGSRTVGILLFDGVEVLDFAGPFEVFSVAGFMNRSGGGPAISPVTIAERSPVTASGGLRVLPDALLAEAPALDCLLVPGGQGTRRQVSNPELLDWIAARAAAVETLVSVCTGAFLLAERGLLDGRPVTTHWASLDRLQATYPAVQVRPGQRFVDDSTVLTSAGVSAGIDLALHLVARWLGDDAASRTARAMEYDWRQTDSAAG